MRIGIVSDVAYPWVKGGLQATEYTEAKSLAKKHEVIFFTLQFEGMENNFVKDGIHYVCVDKAQLKDIYKKGQRSIGLAFRFARALPRYLYNYRLDALYVNTMPYLHLPATKRYGLRTGAKIIFDAIEIWSRDYWTKYIGLLKGLPAYYFANSALRGADYYIANSSTTAAGLSKIGIERSRIRIFSPVIDLKQLNKYRSVPNSAGDGTVIFAGRLIKEKRADLWIDAVAKAHEINSKVKGVIIGEGPEKASLLREIDDKKASRFISILGFISSKVALYKKIAKASIFLNMSEREGLSAVSIESVALGTPVLLPDYTPIPEEVKRMCVVENKDNLPEKIADMVGAKKGQFLKNTDVLKEFDSGRITRVFDSMLKQ